MNIYDEAFNDLLKYFHENKPLENIDDTLVIIEHCLERAEKVEELLGLYHKYFDLNHIDVVNDGHTYGDSRNTQKSILIIKQIKLKEKELEEMNK